MVKDFCFQRSQDMFLMRGLALGFGARAAARAKMPFAQILKLQKFTPLQIPLPGLSLVRPSSSEVTKMPALFDEQGRVMKPSSDTDYFAAFGIGRTFAVDTAELSRTYKALQKQLHPDLFSLKSEEEQEVSLEWSSLVNDGYKVRQSSVIHTDSSAPVCHILLDSVPTS